MPDGCHQCEGASVSAMSGYEELVQAFDQRHPFRTLLRLLRPRRRTLYAAFLLYGIKHTPIWLLPVITADVIDVLVQDRPVEHLWIDAVILVVLVAQNLPVNVAYSMQLSRVLRSLEVQLWAEPEDSRSQHWLLESNEHRFASVQSRARR